MRRRNSATHAGILESDGGEDADEKLRRAVIRHARGSDGRRLGACSSAAARGGLERWRARRRPARRGVRGLAALLRGAGRAAPARSSSWRTCTGPTTRSSTSSSTSSNGRQRRHCSCSRLRGRSCSIAAGVGRAEAGAQNADAGAALGRGDDTAPGMPSSNAAARGRDRRRRCSPRQPAIRSTPRNTFACSLPAKATLNQGQRPRRCRESSRRASTGCRSRRRRSSRTLRCRQGVLERSRRRLSRDAIAGPWRSVCSRSSEGSFCGESVSSAVEGETEYAFHHELVRDVAYGEIPHGERADEAPAGGGVDRIPGASRGPRRAARPPLSQRSRIRGTGTLDGEPALAKQARLALVTPATARSALNAFAQAAGFYREALQLWPADEPGRPRAVIPDTHPHST